MKNLAIIYSKYSPTIDAIKFKLKNTSIDCFDELPVISVLKQYDLVVVLSHEKSIPDISAIAVHYSLLPSFNVDEPVKEAITAGVKVTGITIYNTKTKRIIAQYPVFINNDMHYEDVVKNLEYTEQILLPSVIEKLLSNEPFDTQSLMKIKSSCGGCQGCNH